MKKRVNVGFMFVVVAIMLAISALCTTNLAERGLLRLKSRGNIPTPLAIRSDDKWGAEPPNADGSWSGGKYYMLYAALPEGASGEDLNVRVEYPERTCATGMDEIVITVTTTDDELYEGRYEIRSAENLRIVYGSTDPMTATGGEVSRDDCRLEVFFTTLSDDQCEQYDQYLASRFGWDLETCDYGYERRHHLSGVDGEMNVTFCRL